MQICHAGVAPLGIRSSDMARDSFRDINRRIANFNRAIQRNGGNKLIILINFEPIANICADMPRKMIR